MTRREFVQLGAAAVAVSAGARHLSAAPLRLPIGLQLYSVRELLPKDFDGTLAKVRAAGYTEVEAAGYFDRTAPEFRKSMDAAGLRCISTHHPMAVLKPRLDELIEYGHALGLGYIVCPSPMHRDPSAKGPLTLEDWRWTAGELNKIGEKVNDPLSMYLCDLFTLPLKLGGFPAISIPTKPSSELASGELPIGFQLIGKKWHEADILGIGQYYEKIN